MNLTKEDIGTIIVRVLGIYCLIVSLSLFTSLAQMMAYSQIGEGQFTFLGFLRSLAAILPLILVGLWFLHSARNLGSRLVGSSNGKKSTSPKSAKEWEEIALSTIGVYILVDAIPHVIMVISTFFSQASKGIDFTIQVFSTTMLLLAAFWLVLRAKGAVALIHRLRNTPAAS